VRPEFAALAADRLAPGACWRLATDWEDYAEQMVAVLDAQPGLVGGAVERWADRPVTKFERKGLAAGRPITDLTYRRR
jgi:tRNA (guanine-N7-)-methyltransferase